MSTLLPNDYTALLAEVKARVRAAQYDALRAVNKELMAMYWDIGRDRVHFSGPVHELVLGHG